MYVTILMVWLSVYTVQWSPSVRVPLKSGHYAWSRLDRVVYKITLGLK